MDTILPINCSGGCTKVDSSTIQYIPVTVIYMFGSHNFMVQVYINTTSPCPTCGIILTAGSVPSVLGSPFKYVVVHNDAFM